MINIVNIQIRVNARPVITVSKSGAGTYQNSLTFEITDPYGNSKISYANDSWLNYKSANYVYHVGDYTVQINTSNSYPENTFDGYISDGWGYEPTSDKEEYIFLNVDDWAMTFQRCIYDRTQADVDHIKELRNKWFNGTATESEFREYTREYLKGALNDYDLKRIEYNITYLADKLNLDIETHYDRETQTFDIPELFDTDYFDDLENNLKAIYNTNRHYSSTPSVPTRPFNTYQKLNDIERILYDTYCSLEDYEYTGNELYAGQSVAVI